MKEMLHPPMFQPDTYRLYPLLNQERELLQQFGELRFLWNNAIGERQRHWKTGKKSLSYVSQYRDLARWRAHGAEGIGRFYGHVAQDTLARLDAAFRQFSRRVREGGTPGFPRFQRAITSLTYPDSNGSAAIVPGQHGTRRLHLVLLGDLPIKVSREPPPDRINTCTVERERDRWYAVPTYEVPDPAPPPAMLPPTPIGVELGLSHIAFTSEGERVSPPKLLGRAERRLRHAQRNVSRHTKGAHNREKPKACLAQCHAKVRDQWRDFAQTPTSSWAKRHNPIAFEELAVPSMLGNGHLSRSIADVGWGMLRRMAENKEVRCSGRYVGVPTKGTTPTGSGCGRRADPPLALNDRSYDCPGCGRCLERDRNTVRNLLARALAAVPGGTGESTPVGAGPSPHRKGWQVRSTEQEPPLLMGEAT